MEQSERKEPLLGERSNYWSMTDMSSSLLIPHSIVEPSDVRDIEAGTEMNDAGNDAENHSNLFIEDFQSAAKVETRWIGCGLFFLIAYFLLPAYVALVLKNAWQKGSLTPKPAFIIWIFSLGFWILLLSGIIAWDLTNKPISDRDIL